MTNVTEAEIASISPAPRVTEASIKDKIKGRMFLQPTGTLTICILELWNGFTVTGESACASPENYDREIGERLAFENAFAKIWALEGYRLRSDLALAK